MNGKMIDLSNLAMPSPPTEAFDGLELLALATKGQIAAMKAEQALETAKARIAYLEEAVRVRDQRRIEKHDRHPYGGDELSCRWCGARKPDRVCGSRCPTVTHPVEGQNENS